MSFHPVATINYILKLTCSVGFDISTTYSLTLGTLAYLACDP